MREEEIRDRDLWQRLNRCRKDAQDDAVRVPFSRAGGVRRPKNGPDAEEGGEDVDAATAVHECDGLPNEICPAQEEEHEAGAEIELCDCDSSVLGNGRQYCILLAVLT